MATFLENFRTTLGEQPFTKFDPIAQRRWQQANLQGLEKDIEQGNVQGTKEYSQKEFDTLDKMDRLYRLLANEFQDNFYYKHFDKEKNDWEDVSNKQIVKESTDFLNDAIKNRGLNEEEFANGKTFVENFRKYGYNKMLLPDIKKDSDYTTGVDKYIFRTQPSFVQKKPSAERPRMI